MHNMQKVGQINYHLSNKNMTIVYYFARQIYLTSPNFVQAPDVTDFSYR